MSVYVYCPIGAETGGPEALHQLVYVLRRNGLDAYITPLPGTESNRRVARYLAYNNPEGFPTDTEDESIVVPEIATGQLAKFNNAKKYVWWLAAGYVDVPDATHLAQSQYALDVLAENGVEGKMLSDYTVPMKIMFEPRERWKTVVSYNHSKGGELVEVVAKNFPDIKWIPIKNMTREQVSATLDRSDVYMDLGHHPGKDRMPREAAISGAVVMVGTRGSAANILDVPIAEKADPDNVEEVTNLLRNTLETLDEVLDSQEGYRNKIAKEEIVFDKEVRGIFC